MPLNRAFVPYGAYWSTPFCRWQGSFAGSHSIELAGQVAREVLADRKIDPGVLDGVFLGMTVIQKSSFYGAPWLAALLGAPGVTGPTFSQACATSARVIASAALEVEAGTRSCVLGVLADRTSNGPHIYYPAPDAPGGRGAAEDCVWDSFNLDPWAANAMIETAEAVAKEAGVTRAQQDELTLLRYAQYQDSMANDRAFQRRWMAPVSFKRGKDVKVVAADEGIFPTNADGLAKLRPVVDGGTVTFGSQTHPADGNAGIVVCTEGRARELARDKSITVRIAGFGEVRVEKGRMPKAVVPAARKALEAAGIGLGDLKTVKTHNPFAVNDAFFCKETGWSPERINRFGSPLVYGHPQAPTGCRLVIELIEELVDEGGGWGLFSGCAAGDTAMAIVVKVG
jgi:acetyl-CoA acetyltransferase